MNFESLHHSAKFFRRLYLNLVFNSHEALIPSVFSIIDIFTYLYVGEYVLRSSDANLFISKGHAASIVYPFLIDSGVITEDDICFAAEGSKFGIYANVDIPYIYMPSGSLGHGLGIACGVSETSLTRFPIFVFLGDGECFEGSIYESSLYAKHNNLSNIIVILDSNNRTILGELDNTYPGYDPALIFKSLGYNYHDIDGHCFSSIHNAFTQVFSSLDSGPHLINAKTIKGKGIPFMEDSHLWHNRMPSKQQLIESIELLS